MSSVIGAQAQSIVHVLNSKKMSLNLDIQRNEGESISMMGRYRMGRKQRKQSECRIENRESGERSRERRDWREERGERRADDVKEEAWLQQPRPRRCQQVPCSSEDPAL